jgi:hypothetical protein
MTWQLPDTYHSAGSGRGTATFKFYEGRDILGKRAAAGRESEAAVVPLDPQDSTTCG